MFNQNKILRVFQLISLLKKQPTKSIKFLSGVLGSTERTIYRYFDLIKELGFDLQRDGFNRYYIVGDKDPNDIEFTKEEASLLKELLLSSAKNSMLKDSILKKIYLNSEISIQGNHILNAHLGKMVETLSNSIVNEQQVVLIKYHSANSQKISDRLVEPIGFTDNYSSLCAYEVETGENKFFNIERITDVNNSGVPQAHQDKHTIDKPDAFGFTEQNGEKFNIELKLSLRAYLLLKEEYPLVKTYIKENSKNNTYNLSIVVNNPKPITRFVFGLLDDVEVIGSKEYQSHLKSFIYSALENNQEDFGG